MRNVFVSYSHRLDQDVVDEFRRKFGNDKMVFSDCSLENKDLSHLSDDTIKNNYIRPQLRLSSVTIVLIGAETGGRWWVDWEIYFSLRKSAGNERNGILGILIPNKQHYIPSPPSRSRRAASICVRCGTCRRPPPRSAFPTS